MARISKFKIAVGRERLTKGVDPTEATYTRTIRTQMNAITRNYEAFIRTVENSSPEIILDVLTPTFAKSQTYCPKLTRALVKSGFLEIRNKRVVLGYAKGGKPDYATFVHEMPYYHAPPTRSKFLQAALEEDNNAIRQRLIDEYSKFVR